VIALHQELARLKIQFGHSRRQLLANAAIAAIGAWRLVDRACRAAFAGGGKKLLVRRENEK
jgi:hypothetical protein